MSTSKFYGGAGDGVGAHLKGRADGERHAVLRVVREIRGACVLTAREVKVLDGIEVRILSDHTLSRRQNAGLERLAQRLNDD